MSASARIAARSSVAESAERAELAAPDAIFALVYRQMRAITAQRSRDLDDLVQIALERVLRGLPSFEGRSELSTWTYRICYLTFVTHERTRLRWVRRFILGESVPERPDPGPDVSEHLQQRERVERLRDALARLSPKHRAVVVLHDLEGLGIDEIASIVGAKRNTVKSRLRDGHRELGRALSADPYFGDAACSSEEAGP